MFKSRTMLFFVTIAVFLASANAKFYKDCGSKLATVDNVGVSGCDATARSCILKKDTNSTISIDFTPSVEASGIDADVHGEVLGIFVPFPLPQPDACTDCGLSCPVKSGEKVSYSTSLPVKASYPSIGVNVKWELKTKDGQDLVCIIIRAKID